MADPNPLKDFLRKYNPFFEPFIFEHIFKTAGTSFHHSYLSFAFSVEERFVIDGRLEENRRGIEGLKSLSAAEKRSLRIIAGHNAELLRPVYRRSKYLTLVREPISRVISAYLHAKYHPDMRKFLDNVIERDNISVADFVEEDLLAKRYAGFCSVQNFQSRHLCGLPPLGADGTFTNKDLRQAFKRYRLIGLTEEFPKLLGVLHFQYGFPLILFNKRLIRKERSDFVLAKGEREVIEKYNRRDIRFYEMASERFLKTWNTLRNSRRDIMWGRYLEALKTFQYETRGDENRGRIYVPGEQFDGGT